MYKKTIQPKTLLKINTSIIGETIEKKMRRVVENKEAIKDGAPIIYTPREEGVNPAHNIRTDRFQIAAEKMDYISKSRIAKRQGWAKEAKENMEIETKTETKKDSGAETIQATE